MSTLNLAPQLTVNCSKIILEKYFQIDCSRVIEFIDPGSPVAIVPHEPDCKIALETCRLNVNSRTTEYYKGLLPVN